MPVVLWQAEIGLLETRQISSQHTKAYTFLRLAYDRGWPSDYGS
jgi:hypothetical protein